MSKFLPIHQIPVAAQCINFYCYTYDCYYYDICSELHKESSKKCENCLKKGRDAIPLAEVFGLKVNWWKRPKDPCFPYKYCFYDCAHRKDQNDE